MRGVGSDIGSEELYALSQGQLDVAGCARRDDASQRRHHAGLDEHGIGLARAVLRTHRRERTSPEQVAAALRTAELRNVAVHARATGGLAAASGGSAATAVEFRHGRRVVGASQQTLAKDLVKRYNEGASIRELAKSTGRSYGCIHRVLTESGVLLHQRGGARRRK